MERRATKEEDREGGGGEERNKWIFPTNSYLITTS